MGLTSRSPCQCKHRPLCFFLSHSPTLLPRSWQKRKRMLVCVWLFDRALTLVNCCWLKKSSVWSRVWGNTQLLQVPVVFDQPSICNKQENWVNFIGHYRGNSKYIQDCQHMEIQCHFTAFFALPCVTAFFLMQYFCIRFNFHFIMFFLFLYRYLSQHAAVSFYEYFDEWHIIIMNSLSKSGLFGNCPCCKITHGERCWYRSGKRVYTFAEICLQTFGTVVLLCDKSTV